MQIKCPECAFMREINETQIPASSSFATCPKCATRFRFRADQDVPPESDNQLEDLASKATDEEPAEDIWASMDRMRSDWKDIDREEELENRQAQDPEADARLREEAQRAYQQAAAQGKVPLHTTVGSVPWEYKGGFLNPVMFFRTVGLGLMRIPQFFGGINPFSSILPAWVFMMLVRLIELAAVLYGTRLMVTTPDGVQQPLSLMQVFQIPLPMMLGFAIAIFSLMLFCGAFIVNYAIRMRMPQKANFRLVFKVLAYAHIPALFSLVPGIGMLFSFVGSLALLILGIKHAFRFNWQQTIISLAPYFIIGMLLWGMSMQMSAGMLQG